MSLLKSSIEFQYLKHRMKITLKDGRLMVGRFLAFDKYLNYVLADCQEIRRIPNASGTEEIAKRNLGLVLVRGEEIISTQVDGPPAKEESRVESIMKMLKKQGKKSKILNPQNVYFGAPKTF